MYTVWFKPAHLISSFSLQSPLKYSKGNKLKVSALKIWDSICMDREISVGSIMPPVHVNSATQCCFCIDFSPNESSHDHFILACYWHFFMFLYLYLNKWNLNLSSKNVGNPVYLWQPHFWFLFQSDSPLFVQHETMKQKGGEKHLWQWTTFELNLLSIIASITVFRFCMPCLSVNKLV